MLRSKPWQYYWREIRVCCEQKCVYLKSVNKCKQIFENEKSPKRPIYRHFRDFWWAADRGIEPLFPFWNHSKIRRFEHIILQCKQKCKQCLHHYLVVNLYHFLKYNRDTSLLVYPYFFTIYLPVLPNPPVLSPLASSSIVIPYGKKIPCAILSPHSAE